MLEQGRHGRVLPAVERPFVFPDHRSCLAGEMPAGGKPDDAYSRRSVAPPCHNLGSHGIEGSREPRVQRIPERSSNRSAREARPPALLLPRSVFAADHPAPEYCRIRDEDPLTVRHVRRLRDGDPGAEYLSQGAVGGPRAVLAGQEISTDGWQNSRTPGGISSGGACSAHTWVSSDTSRPGSASCCVSPWQRDPGDVSCGDGGARCRMVPARSSCSCVLCGRESGRRSPGNRGEGPLAGPGAVLSVGDYFKGSEPGS